MNALDSNAAQNVARHIQTLHSQLNTEEKSVLIALLDLAAKAEGSQGTKLVLAPDRALTLARPESPMCW